jgi:hypothetical protein
MLQAPYAIALPRKAGKEDFFGRIHQSNCLATEWMETTGIRFISGATSSGKRSEYADR